MKLPRSRVLLFALVLFGLLLGLMVAGWFRLGVHTASSAPTIDQVRELSNLVTLHVPVSDVQTAELHGYTGGASLVLVVKGDADIGTDLSQARFEQVDQAAKKVVLVLAPPKVLRARLDHTGTHVYQIDRQGLWKALPGTGAEAVLVNKAMANAQQVIEQAADQPELRQRAKRQAERVLGGFFQKVGGQCRIEWRG